MIKIKNLTVKNFMSVGNQTQKYKWVGNAIQIIKDAGEGGIVLMDLLDKLSEDHQQNKTSQEINPPLGRLVDSGVLVRNK